MTGGTQEGANGTIMWAWVFRNERWLIPAFWILIVLGTGWVNASSLITESARQDAHYPDWPHYVNEFTSSGVVLLLVPAIYWLVGFAFRIAREWWQIILLLMAGCIAFSVIHITAMVSLRYALFPLFGGEYGWGPLVTAGIYEFRKDVLSYVTILGVVLLVRSLRDAQMALLKSNAAESAPPAAERLSFRSGTSTFWVAPKDVLYAQAAGNYVELHLNDGTTRLLRQTLSGLESALDPQQFVRTHRSYVVRRSAIQALEPTGSGDHVATLSDTHKVPVSRRYREGLSAEAHTSRS